MLRWKALRQSKCRSLWRNSKNWLEQNMQKEEEVSGNCLLSLVQQTVVDCLFIWVKSRITKVWNQRVAGPDSTCCVQQALVGVSGKEKQGKQLRTCCSNPGETGAQTFPHGLGTEAMGERRFSTGRWSRFACFCLSAKLSTCIVGTVG